MTEKILLVGEVHESLPTVMCESLMNCQIDDSLWCVTTLPNNGKLHIGVVYRSPSSNEANGRYFQQPLQLSE